MIDQSQTNPQHILLDMLSSSRQVHSDSLQGLGDNDWQTLNHIVNHHRLAPILHHNYKTRGQQWPLPQSVRERWAASYQKSALRSLSIRQAINKLDNILNANAIPYAALKGAWLSLHAYPHPALRPMRDIDIIVPAHQAIAAFEALLAAGYTRRPNDIMPAEYALQYQKHMPPVLCPVSRCFVEIHSRIFTDVPNASLRGTIADTDALLGRCIRQGSDSTSISFPSPTDNLLHLIIHSAYDHRFNNGPMVMNDVAATLATSDIEWDRFWMMAEAGNWTSGTKLLLAMTKAYHDKIPSTGQVAAPPSSVINSASELMLLEIKKFRAVASHAELSNGIFSLRSLKYFNKWVLQPKHKIAAYAGLPLNSKWVWAHYPAWLMERVRDKLFRRSVPDVYTITDHIARIESWLKTP